MKSWIIPCNLSYYNVVGTFDSLTSVDWKHSSNVEVGDIVYIYVGRPIKAVLYKCIATKTNLPTADIDDSAFTIDGLAYENYGNYMELKWLEKYPSDRFTLDKMKAEGLRGNIQGPRRIDGRLLMFLA